MQTAINPINFILFTPVSPNNTIERHDIAEILLKEKFDDTKGVIISRKS
jgi:hypothetical protein